MDLKKLVVALPAAFLLSTGVAFASCNIMNANVTETVEHDQWGTCHLLVQVWVCGHLVLAYDTAPTDCGFLGGG